MQCRDSRLNSLRIFRKGTHQFSRDCQAQDHTNCHNADVHDQCQSIKLVHTLMFSGSVIVTDQRTHALNDSVRRHV